LKGTCFGAVAARTADRDDVMDAAVAGADVGLVGDRLWLQPTAKTSVPMSTMAVSGARMKAPFVLDVYAFKIRRGYTT
jgi:hypothetical protein